MLLAHAIWPWQWAPRYQVASSAVLGYFVLLLFARWYFVAVPARAHFRQKLDTLRVLAEGNTKAAALVKAAEGYVLTEGHVVGDVLALRRGEQLAGWRLLHAANRELEAARHVGPATLVRLKAEVGRLQERGAIAGVGERANERDKALLVAARRDAHDDTTDAHLSVAMARNDELDDSAFEAASDLQRKAFWLCLLGLSAATLLARLVDRPALIAAGALGGLLSRSVRPFDRPAKATDYGLGWSSLMLAPVNGALGGLAVMYVLSLLVGLAQVQSTTLLAATNLTTPSSGTFGLAIVAGFSETLLSKLVRTAEQRTLGTVRPTTSGRADAGDE